MKLNLKTEDLICLVKGSAPNYGVMKHPLIKANGKYTGGHVEKWRWNYLFTKLTDKELYRMYLICKESWNVKAGTNN